jgi:hypothetical protein
VRFTYADPPYLGMGKKMYGVHHPDAAKWDEPQAHLDLMEQLHRENDGWALSTHVPGLRVLLPAAPEGTRVLAWVKGFAAWKPNVHPMYAWEPVLLKPLRSNRAGHALSVRDWFKTNMATRRSVPGAKPEAFCHWLFDAAALDPEDEFIDLFPGSGAVTLAWEAWARQRPFAEYAGKLSER